MTFNHDRPSLDFRGKPLLTNWTLGRGGRAVFRRFLIAPVKHLVNVAIAADCVGRTLSPAAPSRSTPIGGDSRDLRPSGRLLATDAVLPVSV